MVVDDLLHKLVEASVEILERLHCCAGQKMENRDEVCRVATAHHLVEVMGKCHQAKQLLVVVIIASAKANSTDDICYRNHYVAEWVEAAISLHDSVELFDQILSLFADVFLQITGIFLVLALQSGEGAQGTVGQLSSGTPYARLVGTESQTLAIIDELEAVQVRSACKLVSLLDESLSNSFNATQHYHWTHTNLDLEDMTVAFAHGSEAQVRFMANFKHVPNDRQGFWSRQTTEPFRNLSVEKLENHVD